jgi:hypothetical protein
VQGNIFRGNVITGNPAVQVSVDHTANSGFDIKNLATAGANAFEGNICLTSLNAPCSPVAPSLTASPNPVTVKGTALGSTSISWNAPDTQAIEIHIGSPSGPLFVTGGDRGSAQTGGWVSEGMTFYLQDVTGGNPLTSDYTLATLVIHLQFAPQASLRNRVLLWAGSATALPLALFWCGLSRRRRSLERVKTRT